MGMQAGNHTTAVVTPGGGETLLSKLFAAFSSQVGIFALGAVSQVILARGLGPEGKGLYSLAILTAATIVAVFHGSYSVANSYYTGRLKTKNPVLAGNSIFLAVVWGGILTALAFKFGGELRVRFLSDIAPSLFAMALIAVIPLMLHEFLNGMLIGLDWIHGFSMFLVGKELLFLSGIAVFAHFHWMSVETAVSLWIIAVVLIVILQATAVRFKAGGGVGVDYPIMGKLSWYGIRFHAANLFSFLRQRFDLFIIAYYLSPSEVGYYSIAVAMIAGIWYLPTAIAQVLTPHIAWRDDKAGNILTPKLCRIGLAVSTLGALALGSTGWLLVKALFGSNFLPAYPALLVLLPGAVTFSLARVLAGDLVGRGKPHYAMMISTAAFFLNLALNLFFIPRLGIVGAALSASLTQVFAGLMFLSAFLRESGVSAGEALWLKSEDIRRMLRWRRDAHRRDK